MQPTLLFCVLLRAGQELSSSNLAAYLLDPAIADVVEVGEDAEGSVHYISIHQFSQRTRDGRCGGFLAKQAGR
jgi:hypothetical protein